MCNSWAASSSPCHTFDSSSSSTPQHTHPSQKLVKDVCGPRVKATPSLIAALKQLAEEFVAGGIAFGLSLACQRQSESLEAADLQLYYQRCWCVPGMACAWFLGEGMCGGRCWVWAAGRGRCCIGLSASWDVQSACTQIAAGSDV